MLLQTLPVQPSIIEPQVYGHVMLHNVSVTIPLKCVLELRVTQGLI